jgi:4-amino-4-deoxy-L-arabinose transferase-like glycosyltransferase
VIVAIGAGAAVLSLLAGGYSRPPVPRFDEKYYFTLAEAIASGTYIDGYIIRPPLYPLFLGALFKMFGATFTATLIVQGLIRGALVAQICYMGWRYFSFVTGAVAGLLLAAYPLLIWINTRLLNEALYLPLFVLSLYMIERAVQSEKHTHALWAGVFSGLAALVRVTSFFFTFVVAIWYVVRKADSGRFSRRSLGWAGLMILALLVTISPWTVRNAVVHRALIPLGNESAFNLYFTVGGVSVREATDQWNSWGTQPERQQEALRRWWEYVKAHPGHHAARLVKHLPRVFDPQELGFATGLAMHYKGVACRKNLTLDKLVNVMIPATFLVVMVGGMVGIFVVRENPARRQLFLLTVVYFIVAHTATVMKARYFLPITCLLSIYAARLIITGIGRISRSG